MSETKFRLHSPSAKQLKRKARLAVKLQALIKPAQAALERLKS